MKLIAIHKIGLPAKGDGVIEYVNPGQEFTVSDKDGDFFLANKAARPVKTETVSSKVVEPENEPEIDVAEERRLALLQKAKDLGIKGVRANSTAETLAAKIAEVEAPPADGGEEPGDLM